ncbi:uncharacterized protein RJT20DRAFT_128424 [Scheffersomyces xylosifermentans]|uniref:uncharacterized protein n=1 Tax=Scheffersomyces xylosifermentans TaxID=1304137 RepID=UPI00315D7E4E
MSNDMASELDILNGTDDFPYPISINRTDFQKFNQEEIDVFLYKNHRFTSIDLLIKELTKLATDLNQNLLDLVNNDYNDFIKLGKSINGGLDLINLISGDLKNFRLDLLNYHQKFEDSHELIENTLQVRQQLIRLKTLAKLNLLLNDQVTNFENALIIDEADLDTVPIDEDSSNSVKKKTKSLTCLYLSISQIFQYLVNQDLSIPSSTESKVEKNGVTPTSNQFIDNYLKTKISSLKFEFKSYLDDVLRSAIKSGNDSVSNTLVVELLNVYKVIGHESDALSIIRRK